MPRIGTGTFQLLTPIQVGALRSSSVVNADFADVGGEITNSLPINGSAGMTGVFRADDGDVASPGIAFLVDGNTGFRWSAQDEMRWVAGGQDRIILDANGKMTLSNGIEVTGSVNLSSVLAPHSLRATGATVATLRREENDTSEHELTSFESGSGAGAKGSLRVVGSASNNVSLLRFYVNNVKSFEWSQTLFTVATDMRAGSAGVSVDADGFFDLPELLPGSPGVNFARVYCKDDSGISKLVFKDSAGTENVLKVAADRQVFTASGTWTKPTTGQLMAMVEMWGGGGAGATDSDGEGGGGGGAYSRRIIALASLSASVSVVVGAGGTATGSNGNPGGSSSFGAYLSAFGGGGGARGTDNASGGGGGGGLLSAGVSGAGETGGDGGTPAGALSSEVWGVENSGAFGGGSGGSSNFGGGFPGLSALFGGGGGGSGSGFTAANRNGGNSVFGGAGGAGATGSTGGTAGSSVFGGAGGSVNVAGSVPAGGGGGGNSSGGAGARGEVRVTCW